MQLQASTTRTTPAPRPPSESTVVRCMRCAGRSSTGTARRSPTRPKRRTSPPTRSRSRRADRLYTAIALAPLLSEPVLTVDGRTRQPRPVRAARHGAGQPRRAARSTISTCPGIYTQATTQRQYPGQTTAANVIGFVHSDGTGAAGIEAAFNDVLAGRDGTLTYTVDDRGQVNPNGPDVARTARQRRDRAADDRPGSAVHRPALSRRGGGRSPRRAAGRSRCSTRTPARCWRWPPRRRSTRPTRAIDHRPVDARPADPVGVRTRFGATRSSPSPRRWRRA